MRVLNQAFDDAMIPEEQAAMPFAGGMLQHGYQCGMTWGATLAAGAQAYRLLGPGTQAESWAIIAAQGLVETFRAHNKHLNCTDLTGIDKSSSTMQMTTYFLLKGGTVSCMRMAVKYAPAAFNTIHAALSRNDVTAPPAPVSCSALLAHKMGASDLHTTMAAGFAGGMGLSGGACGALGAALWITGMNIIKDGVDKLEFNNPKTAEVISRFVKCTGYEFECSKIVGRRFADVADHAAYVCEGGCSKIIEGLMQTK